MSIENYFGSVIHSRTREDALADEDRGRQWNEAELIELALHIGPGDEGEPVVTIMLPRED